MNERELALDLCSLLWKGHQRNGQGGQGELGGREGRRSGEEGEGGRGIGAWESGQKAGGIWNYTVDVSMR